MGLGRVEGITHGYARHGTTPLLVRSPGYRQRPNAGPMQTAPSPAFLDHIDHYAIYKYTRVKAWLVRRTLTTRHLRIVERPGRVLVRSHDRPSAAGFADGLRTVFSCSRAVRVDPGTGAAKTEYLNLDAQDPAFHPGVDRMPVTEVPRQARHLCSATWRLVPCACGFDRLMFPHRSGVAARCTRIASE